MRRSATLGIAGHRIGWRAVMCVAAAALAVVALSVPAFGRQFHSMAA